MYLTTRFPHNSTESVVRKNIYAWDRCYIWV